jgi:hypothetical protein
MPPKPGGKSPARSKSPQKTAVAPGGKPSKAPASSAAVKQAQTAAHAPAPSQGKKGSGTKSPAREGAKAPAPPVPSKESSPGKTETATATASGDTTRAPPLTLSPSSSAPLLQRVGRGYLDRLFQGSHYYRKIRTLINETAEAKNAKRLVLERKRMKREKEISNQVTDLKLKRIKLQESLNVAAFEGNMGELLKLINQGANPLKKDQQGNFAVGEAAVNGQTAIVKLLIEKYDADPNCRGQFDRTPLWRASYNSHVDCIKTLLSLGADPRLQAQAQLPTDIASGDALKVLKEWDVSKTDAILRDRDAALKRAAEKQKAEMEQELSQLQKKTELAKTQYEAAQKRLVHAKQEFERRVFEYDTCVHEGKPQELTQIALNCVKESEKAIEAAEEERDQLMSSYLDSRQVEAETKETVGELELGGEELPLKQFADVVLNDTQNKLKSAPKWPLVLDTTNKIATFLRYRDTNFLDGCNPIQMKASTVRRALLGAIRYGKPLVLDLKDVPLIEFMIEFFNAVMPNLWQLLLSKEILQHEQYTKLIRPEDGDAYAENRFHKSTVDKFLFVVVTSAFYVEPEITGQFVPYRVVDE